MEDDLIHDLSAAYALNALDAEGDRFYERHLAHCARCREDVAAFSFAASSLAYAAPVTELPPALRLRILTAIRAELLAGSPFRRRRSLAPAVAFAAVAVSAVAGFGIWSVMASHPPARTTATQRTLPLTGARGTVLRSGNGEATLIISGLAPAPSGKTYELWVIRKGTALRAGLFGAPTRTARVRLTRRLPAGAAVGISIEPAGGTNHLTQRPIALSAPA